MASVFSVLRSPAGRNVLRIAIYLGVIATGLLIIRLTGLFTLH